MALRLLLKFNVDNTDLMMGGDGTNTAVTDQLHADRQALGIRAAGNADTG